MANGILNYLSDDIENVKLIGTDIKNRGYENDIWELYYGPEYDFFSDDYPYDDVDWIIMNPPYSVIEPFTIRALEIAKKGLQEMETWMRELGLVLRARDLGMTLEMIPDLVKGTVVMTTGYKTLSEEEIIKIYRESY